MKVFILSLVVFGLIVCLGSAFATEAVYQGEPGNMTIVYLNNDGTINSIHYSGVVNF